MNIGRVADKIKCFTSKYANEIVCFSVVAFFVLELINKVYFFIQPDSTWSLSFYPKSLMQLFFIIPVIISYKELNQIGKFFIWTSLIIIVIGLVRFSDNANMLIGGMKHYNKLLLCFYISLFLSLFKPTSKKIFTLFDVVLIINAILIILGLLTGTEYLKSYPFSERFGYSGVFSRYTINDTSLFYLIGNFYLFLRWKCKEISIFPFLIVFISSFFIGTKAVYLQNMILVLYIFFAERKLRWYTIGGTASIVILLLLIYNFSFWQKLFESKGAIAVVTSLRSELFLARFPKAIADGSVVNFLIGFDNPFVYFIEMDLIDLVFTLGLVGSVLIGFFYYKILFYIPYQYAFYNLFALTFLLMVMISGRYTYSGLNAIYLPLFLYYAKQSLMFNKNALCQ